LTRELVRNKCRNCEEKKSGGPTACKEEGAEIFQSIEK